MSRGSESVSEKPTYNAPALDKGLDIIECLSQSSSGQTLAEIAQQLGRKQNELFRMITCLEERGYVVRESDSATFSLSLKLFSVVHRQSPVSKLREAAQLPMELLSDTTGHSCHLSVIHSSSMLVLMEQVPKQIVSLCLGVGNAWPLHRTASGKLMLSRLPEERIRQILYSNNEFSGQSKAKQTKLLSEIEALSDIECHDAASEYTSSTADMSVIIGNEATGSLSSLAISYVNAAEIKPSAKKEWTKALQTAAAQIHANLGLD